MARKASRLGTRSAATSAATIPTYRVVRPRIRPSVPYFIPSRAAPARRHAVHPGPVRRPRVFLPSLGPVRSYLMRTGLGDTHRALPPASQAPSSVTLLSRDSLAPRISLRAALCVRRKVRRQVMFATGYAGSRLAARAKKTYNVNSTVRCV